MTRSQETKTAIAAIFLAAALGSGANAQQASAQQASAEAAEALPGAGGRLSAASSPAAAIGLLAKCINIDNWFSVYSPSSRYATRLGSADFAIMKAAGFTAVRLTIAPQVLFDEADPARPKPSIAYVDRAVDLALAAGLGLVFDPIHGSSDDDAFEHSLARDPAFEEKVEAFWESLARRYAAVSPDRILFEVMNEPHLSTRERIDPSWWPKTQAKLAAAIRRGAPRNTIVATGEKWGGVDGLLAIEPLPDPNVVYSFHCYEPFAFTHQGAEWTDPVQKDLARLPYPSRPESLAPILPSLPSRKARERAASYGEQRWDAGKLRAFVGRAADWAGAKGAVVWCGEFGTYKKVAPAEDRLRWIRDMRGALEGLGIGWAMWEYDQSFGFVSYRDPRHGRGRIVDAACLEALGLSAQAAQDAAAAAASVEGTDSDAAADFESGASSVLDLPLGDLGSLWARESGAGELNFPTLAAPVQDAAPGAPAASAGAVGGAASGGAPAGDGSARLVHKGKRDWAISSTYAIAVKTGERFRLSARASMTGEGRLSLECVAYGADGKVRSWSLGAVSPKLRGSSEELSSDFAIPAGVARIEPRWSGQGLARAELGPMRLERLAAAPGAAP